MEQDDRYFLSSFFRRYVPLKNVTYASPFFVLTSFSNVPVPYSQYIFPRFLARGAISSIVRAS